MKNFEKYVEVCDHGGATHRLFTFTAYSRKGVEYKGGFYMTKKQVPLEARKFLNAFNLKKLLPVAKWLEEYIVL